MSILWLTSLLLFVSPWTSALPGSPALVQEPPAPDFEPIAPPLQRPQLVEIYRFEDIAPTSLPAFTRSGRFLALPGEPVRFLDLDQHRLLELGASGAVTAGGAPSDLFVRTRLGLERWDLARSALLDTRVTSPGLGLPVTSPSGEWLYEFGEFLTSDRFVSLGRQPDREVKTTFGLTGRVLWQPDGHRVLLASHRSFCAGAVGGELALVNTQGSVVWRRALEEAERPRAWSFSPKGDRVLVATSKGIDLRSTDTWQRLRGEDLSVRDVAWLDEQRALVLDGESLTLWHPATLSRAGRLLETEASDLVLAPDQRHLVLSDESGLAVFTLLNR